MEFHGIIAGAPQPPGRLEEVALDHADLLHAERPHRLARRRMHAGARTHGLGSRNGPTKKLSTMVELRNRKRAVVLDRAHDGRSDPG